MPRSSTRRPSSPSSSSGRESGRALRRGDRSCGLDPIHQPLVQREILAQLGMERDGEDVSLPDRDRVSVHLGQDLHPVPDLLDPRGSNEDGIDGDPIDFQIRFKRRQLTPESVTPDPDVENTEMVAIECDHPSARSEHRLTGPDEVDHRLGKAFSLDSKADRRGLAARDDEGVESFQVLDCPHLLRRDAQACQGLRVCFEAPLQGENADQRHRSGAGTARPSRTSHQPRCWSSPPFSWSVPISIPGIASPSSREAAATRSGSLKCVVASTIARARCSGSEDLKMPEPTKLPSAPSCIISAASAGVAMPPAQNSTTGSPPSAATCLTSSSGAWSSFAAVGSSISLSDCSRRSSPVIMRMWRTASTTLPVPASPFERIIAAPSAIRRSASPRLVAPHTNGTLKAHLSMWCASSAGVSTSDSST